MGKRKERRLAAMSAAGRRVKLDLFAEPSGDFGDSTNDEVERDGDSKNRAGSPNSPSSSGQKPENPLLLLGQYSDEELEEESGKGPSRDTEENSPADLDDKVKLVGSEGIGGDKDENLTGQRVRQDNIESPPPLDALHKVEENGVGEDNAVDFGDPDGEKVDMVEQTSVPAISDIQTTGDVSSGWKMVLHEESNSYYYWNIVTGETSWEVPIVLCQGMFQETEPSSDQKTVPEAEGDDTLADTRTSNATLDVELDTSVAAEPNDSRPELDAQNDEMAHDKNKVGHVNLSDVPLISSSVPEGSPHPNGASFGYGVTSHTGCQDMGDHGNQETLGDLFSDSSRLSQLGEYLLERLNSLKGSGGCSDQISKFRLELDIRLKDIKSLAPYGSSLLPFWLHTENQLKQIEAAMNSVVHECSEPARTCETEDAKTAWENTCDASTDEKSTASSTSLDLDSGAFVHGNTIKEVEKDSVSTPAVHPENVTSLLYPFSFGESAAGEGMVEAHGNAFPATIIEKTEVHSEEDVDMDVEMEVEDATPPSDTPVGGIQDDAQLDHSAPPKLQEPIGSEQGFYIPPPPDDEWIPPPPPDDEPLPPPPPDEPPEPPISQSQAEIHTAQPYSYTEQYALTYPGSNFEYYGGQTSTEVPSNSYYVDANGCQVAAPLPTGYYAAVPNLYPDTTSVVNSVEPVAYYTVEGGSVSSAHVISSVETAGLHTSSVHGSIASDQIGTVETQNDASLTSLSSSRVDVSAVGGEMKRGSIVGSSILVSTRAPAATTVVPGASLVSAPANAETAALTEVVSKVQPKVSRVKKRTVATVSTLRSNKKVSGLVDKWKAVKEELHEDEEDEPQNAYEMLEKKRQREIELWHAQQLASGEAKDNANFQPLGGDWRERVKRKRAKKMSEAEESPQEEDHNNKNHHPDLEELSKELPPGWQAYWDESSKQVYYGNLATSETTWIKPIS